MNRSSRHRTTPMQQTLIASAISALFAVAGNNAMAACSGSFNSAGDQGSSPCLSIQFDPGSDATTAVTLTNNGGTSGITNASGTANIGSVIFSNGSGANVTGSVGASGTGSLNSISGGAGWVTFSNANPVYANTVSFNGASTLNFTHGLTGTTLDFNGQNGYVFLGNYSTASNLSLTTLVAGGGAVGTGSGSLYIYGNTTISGAIGSATNQLRALSFDSVSTTVSFSTASQPVYAVTTGGSGSVSFAGGLAGTTLNVGGTSYSSLAVQIGAGKNLAANVTNYVNGGGSVEFLGSTTIANNFGVSASQGLSQIKFDGGNASIGGDLHTTNTANSILISNGATATYSANQAFSGRMTLGATGVLDLGSYTVTGATTGNKSDLVTVAGSTIKTSLISDATNSSGKMSVDGTNTVIATGTNVVVSVPVNVSITNGRQFTILSAANGSSVGAVSISDDSAVLNFTQVADTTNLTLQANRSGGGYVAAAGLTSSSQTFGPSSVLDQLASSGTASGDMLTVTSTLDGYNSSQLNTALRRAAPVSNHSISLPVITSANASLGLSESRLASLRGESSPIASTGVRGLAAGDSGANQAVWVKVLGNKGRQSAKDGFDGYKTSTYGLGLGADVRLPSDWTVGVGLTYGHTTVDQQDQLLGDSTTIRSGQLTGYAGKEFGPAYLDVLVSYAALNFDSTRATALSRTASGSYNGHALAAKVGGGYKIALGNGSTVIPMASLETTSLKRNSYTETGAGALNVSYSDTTTNRTQSSLGVRLVNDQTTGSNGKLKLEGRLAWLHDFNDSGTDITGSFTGGGGVFVTNGQKIAKDGWNLGLGSSYTYGQGTSVSVQYDHEGRSGYHADSLQLVGRWLF